LDYSILKEITGTTELHETEKVIANQNWRGNEVFFAFSHLADMAGTPAHLRAKVPLGNCGN